MKIVDVNVLLYAVNEDAPDHAASKEWLQRSLSGAVTVGFAWLVLIAFVRLVSKPGLFPRPLPVDEAVAQVEEWLAQPGAVVVEPAAHHGRLLADLLRTVGSGGNLVNDAHLAALAIAHRAEIVSFDRDFARFPGVTWELPT